jgi:Uma2 family endonuclease
LVVSTSVQRKRATYEDLRDVPSDKVAEILDGELFASARPALPHASASTTLGGEISTRFHRPAGGGDNPGGWWILFEPELHFHEDVVVPDVAGWRRERVPLLPNAAWFAIAPDWVCEVVSPSTEAIDRGRKLRIYAREGVGHLWLVNPLARTLEVYRLSDGKWTLVQTSMNDEIVRAEPFESVSIEMSRWWLPETPPESSPRE